MRSYERFLLLSGAFTSLGANAPIDLKRLWPQPNAGEALVVRFNSGRIVIYRKADDGYTLQDNWHINGSPDDPSTLKWSSTWHYRLDPLHGVVEFGDDVPGPSDQPTAQPRFMRGNEIIWGNALTLGGQIDQKVAFAHTSDRRAFARNRLTLLGLLPHEQIGAGVFTNVVRLRNQQDVCDGSTGPAGSLDQAGPVACTNYKTSITDYHFAPGIGFISLDPQVVNGQPPVIKNETAVNICHIPAGQPTYCPARPVPAGQ